MARDLSLYDSGELALAAVQLGLAHPPGQPLHTIVGFVFSHLPFVAPLVGVNLVSALPSALTLIPATSLGQRLLGDRATPAALAGMPWLLAACALHPCVWEPATRVEVYALASLGAVWSLAASADFAREIAAEGGWHESRSTGRILRLGTALGLTASVNPVIALATALAISPELVAATLSGVRAPARAIRKLVLCAIGGGVLGLLPYGYLPLVAGRTDVMVWGGPHDLPSYLHYVLLRDYAHNQAITLALWTQHWGEWLQWAGRSGLWPVSALGLIAHAWFGKGAGRLAIPLAFLSLLSVIAANVVWNVEVPDYNGYLATPLWGLAAGAMALGLRAYRSRGVRSGALVLSLGCVVSAFATSPSVLERTRSRDHLARALAERVLRDAPPRAIVISETDAVTGALFYLQGAEHARADVTVLAYGLASSSWHWDQLLRTHPDLKRIALQGSGGRAGRVRRFLEANPARPAMIEQWSTGRELGLALCAGGLFFRTGAACTGDRQQDPAVANEIAEQLARLAGGSPSTSGAIAQTTYELGEGLWRLGDAKSAHDVLLAGVSKTEWPSQILKAGFEQARPLPPSAASMHFERAAALGDPGRNLFLAGAIVSAAGKRELAAEYLRAAAQTGLPEAARLLAREATPQRAAR